MPVAVVAVAVVAVIAVAPALALAQAGPNFSTQSATPDFSTKGATPDFSTKGATPDFSDEAPLASILSKVTWSRASGVTRIAFHGSRPIEPLEVTRASPGVLRIDLTAVDAAEVPRSIAVETPEVAEVVRVPATLGLLPEGVSARFLVRLGPAAGDFAALREGHGFDLHVGDERVVERRVEAGRPAASAWVEAAMDQGRLRDDPPAASDRITPRTIRLDSERPIRTAPNALAAPLRSAAAGARVTIDAQRGDWLHLSGGGWILQAGGLPEPGTARVPSPAPSSAVAARSERVLGIAEGERPATWTVVTLGTGLAVELRELTQEEAVVVAPVARLFVDSVRLAVVSFAARGSRQYGFRIPPKGGRFTLELADGRVLESLDPTAVELVPGATKADVLAAFPTAELVAGQGWSGLVPLPPEADLARVEGVRVEVGGQEHRLFPVPGTGLDVGE